MKAIVRNDLIIGFWRGVDNPTISIGETIVDLGPVEISLTMHQTHRYDSITNTIKLRDVPLTITAYEAMRSSDSDTWAKIENNDLSLVQITTMETTATPRRVREAALGMDNGWLKALDAQIAKLRAQLLK